MGQKILIGVLVVAVVLLALPLVAQLVKRPEAATAAQTPSPAPAETSPAEATPPAFAPPSPSPGPQVVFMQPANGSTNVNPALDRLIVVFDRPMRGGFSWTGGGEQMPEGTGKPFWGPDRKTCTLPVRLRPNWSYRLGLNSPSHKNFKAEDGAPLSPMRWTFQTGG